MLHFDITCFARVITKFAFEMKCVYYMIKTISLSVQPGLASLGVWPGNEVLSVSVQPGLASLGVWPGNEASLLSYSPLEYVHS